jgi:1-acyl-sn-glycerol-3-phosphate acyltransferase
MTASSAASDSRISARYPKPTLMIWLRSWLYLFLFLGWTISASIFLLPTLVNPRWTLSGIRLWIRGIMFLGRTVVGITCRVVGREHVPPGACIIAAQHQASYETFRLFMDIDHPIFILKRELTWIPFIGWYMTRAGFVGIDRGAGAGAMRKMLRETERALEKGYQVVVFPEGTRVPVGETRPYRPGIVVLYNQCTVPVIPMALNSGFFWGKTRILKMPGEIVFQFFPALPTGLDKDSLLRELRTRLESAGSMPDSL